MKKLLFLIPLGLAGIMASCQQELEPSANVDSQVAEATFVEPEPDSLLVNTYELNRVISKYAKAVGMPRVLLPMKCSLSTMMKASLCSIL